MSRKRPAFRSAASFIDSSSDSDNEHVGHAAAAMPVAATAPVAAASAAAPAPAATAAAASAAVGAPPQPKRRRFTLDQASSGSSAAAAGAAAAAASKSAAAASAASSAASSKVAAKIAEALREKERREQSDAKIAAMEAQMKVIEQQHAAAAADLQLTHQQLVAGNQSAITGDADAEEQQSQQPLAHEASVADLDHHARVPPRLAHTVSRVVEGMVGDLAAVPPFFTRPPQFPPIKTPAMEACADLQLGLFALDYTGADGVCVAVNPNDSDDQHAISEFLASLADRWSKERFDQRTADLTKQLLWRLAAYSNVQRVAEDAYNTMLVVMEAERHHSAATATSHRGQGPHAPIATSFSPIAVTDFFIAPSPMFPQLAATAATPSSSASSAAASHSAGGWVVTFAELLQVLRAFGANLGADRDAMEIDGDDSADTVARCSHADALNQLSSPLFPAGAAEAAPIPSASASLVAVRDENLRRALLLFSLHLSLHPHTRIFRTMCDRHNCVILLLKLMLDDLRRRGVDSKSTLIHKLLMQVMEGYATDAPPAAEEESGGGEESKQQQSASKKPRAYPSLRDADFTTLCSLFLSPLVTSAPHLLLAASRWSNVHSLLRQVLHTCSLALARSAARGEPVSASMLTRAPAVSDFVSLLQDPRVLQQPMQLRSKAGPAGDNMRLVRCLVLCGSFLLGDREAGRNETKDYLHYVKFLTNVRQAVGMDQATEVAVLKVDTEIGINMIAALRLVYRTMSWEANRASVHGQIGPTFQPPAPVPESKQEDEQQS